MRIERLAARQKGLVRHHQLTALGLTENAKRHRVARGALHPKWPGVYAVGRAEVTREAEWLVAVMTCGRGAVLSHSSAAALWRIRRKEGVKIEISLPTGRDSRREGTVHRRRRLRPAETTTHRGIPVTRPVLTLTDLATQLDREPLEEAVNEAIRLGLTSQEDLQASLPEFIAGLPKPLTQERVNGFEVDFFWPHLGLVVETDGGAFHRTAAQQTRDRLRDQAHTAAGLTPLRFTHRQIAHQGGYVTAILARITKRLSSS